MSEKTFDEKFTELLKTHNDFVDDTGELLRDRIKRCAYDLDKDLITLLLSDDTVATAFFVEIAGRWIFNNNKFVAYLNDTNFLDKSYTKFKNKIRLTIDGKYLQERGEVALVWPYKDCVLEGGQTKEKEKEKETEIFFNEILAPDEINQMFEPKVLTNWKRYTVKGEQDVTGIQRDENGTIRENLIIKGNNLITLHTLKKQFREQVKLIYIDPPYNTGGSIDSFSYNNEFKHSTWLTFIRNRIEIAKELLKNDGFIAVTIDHVELFYLGVLLDEIFGRENRIGIVTIYINPKGRQHERFFSAATEHMLVYAKDISKAEFNKVALDKDKIESFDKRDEKGNYRLEPFIRVRSNTLRTNKPKFWYPIYVSKDLKDITLTKKNDYHEIFPINNGREFTWKTKPETFEKRNVGDYFVAVEQQGEIIILHKYREQQVIKNLWMDKKYFPEFQGTNLLKNLLGENLFSYPKSLYAVLDTLKIMTGNNDIILDFFSGSGTTAHAVLELNKQDNGNRKFILVEQMDYVENVTVKRMEKVIEKHSEGDFIYCELKAYNEAFMERIQSAESTEQLLEIWREMPRKSILNWYINPKAPKKAEEEFIKIDNLNQQKQELAKQLDKNQLYVNLSEIADETYEVSKSDKQLNTDFYANKGDDDE